MAFEYHFTKEEGDVAVLTADNCPTYLKGFFFYNLHALDNKQLADLNVERLTVPSEDHYTLDKVLERQLASGFGAANRNWNSSPANREAIQLYASAVSAGVIEGDELVTLMDSEGQPAEIAAKHLPEIALALAKHVVKNIKIKSATAQAHGASWSGASTLVMPPKKYLVEVSPDDALLDEAMSLL
ncbi:MULTISPECIES: hypothetical protein [unclassified Pseudovibrio]|uniref:hypothetical protein n=1 Tax=unclassified Pseudovibrio TaxID=2627060 RepID=UPI0007AEABD5|nr:MULTISPECIES: hypothetical protein [unclassified Pseudovibrio]KZK92576.1 hypothetical protein PsW74_05503 [Pseudovibrio sp. W74]KZL10380.1 hypothetical protein PsAD14_01287 [Pseudovibrio sp. Ad14]